MPALLDHIDPTGLEEFSVVFTDRSLNHMSKEFQRVMCDLSSNLKEVYNANSVVLVPGGGTFAMEAVARQFGVDASVLVVRNGWFSYRWSQIFEASANARATTVVKARMVGNEAVAPFRPADVDDVIEIFRKLESAWIKASPWRIDQNCREVVLLVCPIFHSSSRDDVLRELHAAGSHHRDVPARIVLHIFLCHSHQVFIKLHAQDSSEESG